jgi:glycine/D-amino acid oxidase-like deaminating enzyme
MATLPQRADFVIVGGGIAGAALAWELSRRDAGSIVLVEREVLAGTHASGRNAALILQNVSDPVDGALAQYGGRFYSEPPDDLEPRPEFRRLGSLLLASGADAGSRLEQNVERARSRGLEVVIWSAAEAARRVPILDPSRFVGGAFCQEDGVIDIHGLLQAFLGSAIRRGVTVHRNCTALAIRSARGRAIGVGTSQGDIACGVVVNAAGGWANALGATSDVTIPALRPTRRHLFVTEPSPRIDPAWPFIWDIDRGFYFRPESGGLLMCPCDVVDAPDLAETVDPMALERTAMLASELIPSVGGLGVAHSWSGIRTLTPDDRFLIGFDPRLEGYFWLAGLGGHGIVGAPASSFIAADLLMKGRTELMDPVVLGVERFL